MKDNHISRKDSLKRLTNDPFEVLRASSFSCLLARASLEKNIPFECLSGHVSTPPLPLRSAQRDEPRDNQTQAPCFVPRDRLHNGKQSVGSCFRNNKVDETKIHVELWRIVQQTKPFLGFGHGPAHTFLRFKFSSPKPKFSWSWNRKLSSNECGFKKSQIAQNTGSLYLSSPLLPASPAHRKKAISYLRIFRLCRSIRGITMQADVHDESLAPNKCWFCRWNCLSSNEVCYNCKAVTLPTRSQNGMESLQWNVLSPLVELKSPGLRVQMMTCFAGEKGGAVRIGGGSNKVLIVNDHAGKRRICWSLGPQSAQDNTTREWDKMGEAEWAEVRRVLEGFEGSGELVDAMRQM